MNTKTLLLILSAVFLFPVVAWAQTIADIVNNVVVNVAWPVAIGTIVIFWIVTGILFLSAMGSPEKLSLARKALIAAVSGTIVIVLAASAIVIIRNTLGL